ncbi:hypothetical protein C9939_00720 [Pseudidiomarina aestuarii]|nr:hypothetical protein C9939_00720 [Pseudidiomarina aestuarii]
MGEASKTSGEIGEKIAAKLLEEIGWKNSIKNISIKCTSSAHRNKNDKQVQTHGDDLVFIYDSPFHDDTTEVVHISVKNSVKEVKSPSGIVSDFKKHIKELNDTIECATSNPEINEIIERFEAKRRIRHNGLLVWTHCGQNSLEANIRQHLSKIRIPDEIIHPIYLIDNERASFLIQTINHAKHKHTECDRKFYYPKIGTAIYDEQDRYGDHLPLELISSDIVPWKITKSNDAVEISIYANQEFEKETYQKLMFYAYSFSAGISSSISLGTTNYNEAHHKHDADSCKLSFKGKTEKVIPFSFGSSFLSLLEQG